MHGHAVYRVAVSRAVQEAVAIAAPQAAFGRFMHGVMGKLKTPAKPAATA
jgi:hypothetical protein